MTVIQNMNDSNLPGVDVSSAASGATRRVHVLSYSEVQAVAGGPEGSVGTGLGPPQGMQMLTPQEITAVAGGPEGTVGTGLNPPAANS